MIAEYVARWVPPDARVLEIGAGYCCWINARPGARTRRGRRLARASRGTRPPGVEAVVLDLSTGLARFADESFDLVLASNVIEHFEPDAAAA